MKKKFFFLIILFVYSHTVLAQENQKAIKIIPQMSFKIGSQHPAVGGQFDMVAGLLLESKYFAGIGSGYCTNMGMGGSTYPIYIDGRYYFSLPKSIVFRNKDEVNDFQVELQLGASINNNLPYKTGFIATCGFAYCFDFIKIKSFKFPSFYAGLNFEYNYTRFKDEYLGYTIQDGHLSHIMLNLKVAFNIPSIKI